MHPNESLRNAEVIGAVPLRGNDAYAPEYGEHVRDAPDSQDLVLDHLPSLGFLAVDCHRALRWFVGALVELLLSPYIKHRNQHVRNCGDIVNHRRTTGIPCALTLLPDER